MKKVLALVLSLVMVLYLCGTAFADFYTDADLEAFDLGGYTPNEIRNDAVSRAIALDSYILLKNDGVLPIAKEGKIALFGNGATGTIKGGSGSGIVNQRERDWIDTAFADAGYEITTPQAYFNAVGRGNVATGFSGDREAADVALTDEWLEEAAAADTAIYVLARTAGEGSDRRMDSGNGAWELYAQERGNLEKIAATFENVVIVLNTYVTDITWLNEIDNIDSVLFVGYGGQRTGETTLQVLNGDVTPSGKTISTWAWELDDYLSSQAGFSWMDGNTDTEFYNDGIYVGYRYFDTFGLDDEVAFPFGFGLSYTEFKIDVKDVKIDADEVAVTVSVVNTGDYSGKEVVQVYFSAPDGTLEKPYQELAAFGKTDLLAPGEKQTLVIKFATTDMSSYSEELAAYIMEPGEYYIRVGNSSRNTHIAAAGVVEETIITEQLSNQFALEDGAEEFLNEVSKAGARPITYPGEAAEKRNAPKTVITGIETVNNASPYDDETAVTYLFAADAENYEPRTGIHLVHGNATGVI
jgi:beta-glucosidase